MILAFNANVSLKENKISFVSTSPGQLNLLHIGNSFVQAYVEVAKIW